MTTNSSSHRPQLSLSLATTLTRDLYGLHVQRCRELESFEDRNFHVEVDTSHTSNTLLHKVCCHGYVLKVLNSEDSRDPDVIEAKTAIVQHVHGKGLATPSVVPSLSGQLFTMCSLSQPGDTQHYEIVAGRSEEQFAVRLLEYMPGRTLASVAVTPQLCFQVGQWAAEVDTLLQDFSHNNCPDLTINWSMENVPSLRHLLYVITDQNLKRIISDLIDEFESSFLSNGVTQGFQRGIIHADLNDHNFLVSRPSEKEEWRVCGLLDFGDTSQGYLLVEVAIAMAHLMARCPNHGHTPPHLFAGHALAGYLSKLQLSKKEISLLPLTVCIRFTQILVFGHRTMKSDPDNAYVTTHVRPAAEHLLGLRNTPRDVILSNWKDVVTSYGVPFPV